MGWYYYLEDKLHFPFLAKCITDRAISPLRICGRNAERAREFAEKHGMGSRAMEWGVELYGESGSLGLTMNFADGWKIWGIRSAENEIEYLEVPASMMEGVQVGSPMLEQFAQIFTRQPGGCRLFIDAIRAGHQVVPSFADGYKAQRVIETAFASHRQGRRLSISEVCGVV